MSPFDDLAVLALCDGYGGTELALRSLGRIRTVARVERDAYAAAVLVARMEEARLDRAPVWDSLETFDGRPWRGRVDCITAGFPCQPWSSAGAGGGIDDPRWLWPTIARIIADVGPRIVLLENVPGLNAANWRRSGLQYVLQDLANLRFDAEWGLLPASAVGAPHRRDRFWLVAHDNRHGLPLVGERHEVAHHADRRSGAHVGTPGRRRSAVVDVSTTSELADTTSFHAGESHDEECPDPRELARPDIGRHRFPPRRDDTDGWARWEGPQPAVRRSADGAPEWLADALHLGGNGLVPQCAAAAWSQLAERLTDR